MFAPWVGLGIPMGLKGLLYEKAVEAELSLVRLATSKSLLRGMTNDDLH